jgi:hypothetical protein
MKTIQTIFENFKGNWSIDRVMIANDRKIEGTAKGKATFALFNSIHTELFFHEEGTAVYSPDEEDSTENSFFRDYLYRLHDNKIEIYHAGGQQHGELYQRYQLNDEANRLDPEEIHPCGPDFYNGFYELADENNFTLTTKIWGSGTKNSTIKTIFRRLSR